jgi:transcriptional regulator with XRE-family HTH domain
MAGEMAERIGARIRGRRLQLGMKQRELADMLGSDAIDNQRISDWERGVNRPSDRYMEKLAAALQRDVSWFFRESQEDAETPTPFAGSDTAHSLDETLREIREQNTIILDAIHHSAEQGQRQRDEIIAGIETLLEALEGRVEESVTGVEHLQNAFDRVLEALDAPDSTADSEQSSPPKPETARRARSRQRASSAPR